MTEPTDHERAVRIILNRYRLQSHYLGRRKTGKPCYAVFAGKAPTVRQVTELLSHAEAQRDTIRGRKVRKEKRKWAELARREASIVRGRWPQFQGRERTGWQAHLHEHRVPA